MREKEEEGDEMRGGRRSKKQERREQKVRKKRSLGLDLLMLTQPFSSSTCITVTLTPFLG